MMVAIGVVFLVFAVSIPLYIRARNQSRMVHCMGNLRGLGRALNIYLDLQEGSLPAIGASLRTALAEQLEDPSSLVCPVDRTPGSDSYTAYYAARKPMESSDSYLVGCGRHNGHRRAICLLLDFTTAKASYNTRASLTELGKDRILYPGEQAASGTIALADGTRLTLSGAKLHVDFLLSFLLQPGPYHVFRIPLDSFGTLEVAAAQGARFDLITPSANFRTTGASFSVQTGLTPLEGGRMSYSLLRVESGKVEIAPIVRGRISELAAGKQRTIIGPAFSSY